jgi:hypothetical protein
MGSEAMKSFGHFDKAILVIVAGGVVLYLLTLFTIPIADDWNYLTSPRITEFRLAHYRRLFDVLIGMFNQAHPEWFPHLNRILIVMSHTVCAVFLYKISTRILSVRWGISLAFSLLFLIGGNTIVTVLSYDCFNQTGSLMFGAIGIYYFVTAKKNSSKYIAYFVSCALALCVKESSIVYFVMIPLFGTIKNLLENGHDAKTELKQLSRFYIPGFICTLLYYFSPIIQSEALYTYGMRNDSLMDFAKGIVRRVMFSYTQIDQTSVGAIRTGSAQSWEIPLTGIVAILSIPILLASLIVIINMIRKSDKRFVVVLLLVLQSLIVFTPTLMATSAGTIWSYNCIVFFANLVFCFLLNVLKKKHVVLCIAAVALSSTLSAANIYYHDIQTGNRQSTAMQTLQEQLDAGKEISGYVVYNLNSNRFTSGFYPIRLYTMQQMSDLGVDLVSVFGYGAKATAINLTNDVFEYGGNWWSKPEYLDLTDEELFLYAQQEARKSVDRGDYDAALVLLPTDDFYLYQIGN